MAQMQSAPSLPAGNPSAREYFNYSMETLSNAAMPQAMMPQGISSLVPQYQFGGGIGYSGDVGIDWGSVAAAIDAAQAQADATAAADAAAVDSMSQPSVQSDVGIPATSAPAPGFDPGTSYATSPSTLGAAATSVDPAVIAAARSIDKSLSDAEDTQMQQLAGDLNALMSQMQGEAARGTFSRDDAASFQAQQQAQQEAQQALSGINQTNIRGTFSPPPSLLQSALNLVDNYAMPSNRGPGLVVSGALGPFGFVPALVTRGAQALGLKAGDFYGGQGGFDSDLAGLSTPSQSEIDNIIDQMTPPDTGDDGEPDLGDPQQAAAAVAPAYVPPVYQTYAGLGLPSVSPIPPLRRVTVPISSFVV